MQLISDVKDKVKEQFGVTMEPEVKTCWKVLKRSSTDEICNCNRNVRSRKKQCIKDIRRCWIFFVLIIFQWLYLIKFADMLLDETAKIEKCCSWD